MKRWYFTHHLHSTTYSVYQADYETGGYETKEQAVNAALKQIDHEVFSLTAVMKSGAEQLVRLHTAKEKLLTSKTERGGESE